MIEINLYITEKTTFKDVADFVQACQDTFDYSPSEVIIRLGHEGFIPMLQATRKEDE